MSASKITVNKLELSPGVWRMKINRITYDANGKSIRRDESYPAKEGLRPKGPFRGNEDAAEFERRLLLRELGTGQKAERAADPLTSLSAAVAASDMTVGEYAERWLERRLLQAVQGRTEHTYRQAMRLYVLPSWGHLKLATVCRDQLIEGGMAMARGDVALTGRSAREPGRSGKPLSARTIDSALTLLKSVLIEADERGLCKLSACDFKKVKAALPKPPHKDDELRNKALSDVQTDRLTKAIEGHWLEARILFALASGARRGEICALKWNAVHFVEGHDVAVVRITQSVADNGKQIWLKGTKNGKSREISVAGKVVPELRKMRQAAEAFADTLGMDVEGMFVFPNTRGEMMNPGDLSEQVRMKIQAAGLVGFSMHSCRHTHASTLLRNGESITAVSKRLGHSDPGFTLRVYTWAMPSEDIKLALTMAKAMGGSRELEAA
jgi:integrase